MTLRQITLVILFIATCVTAGAATPILGPVEIDSTAMTRFVRRHNPDFDPAIARAFHEIGEKYGIRGDIALCQAIIETGWFKFDNGTAVCPHQHNYCGMGVTTRGKNGCTFESIEQGVTALIQHLFAYCCDLPIPDGEEIVDPRYKFVGRGVAPNWEDLNGRWAMNHHYAHNILKLYKSLKHNATHNR